MVVLLVLETKPNVFCKTPVGDDVCMQFGGLSLEWLLAVLFLLLLLLLFMVSFHPISFIKFSPPLLLLLHPLGVVDD